MWRVWVVVVIMDIWAMTPLGITGFEASSARCHWIWGVGRVVWWVRVMAVRAITVVETRFDGVTVDVGRYGEKGNEPRD